MSGATFEAQVARLSDRYRCVRIEMVAGAGHFSSIEQPDAVADLIESFIRD